MHSYLDLALLLLPRVKPSSLTRLGRNRDGGYVVPKYMTKNKCLISAGIYIDSSFERATIRRYNIKTSHAILIDKSIEPIEFIASLYKDLTCLRFIQFLRKFLKYLYDSVLSYQLRSSIIYKFLVSSSSSLAKYDSKTPITLQECIHKLPKDAENRSIILKIDIEGSEYSIFDDIISTSKMYTMIIMEIHDINIYSVNIIEFVRSLSKNGFVVAHVHPKTASPAVPNLGNTCIEVTFCHSTQILESSWIDYDNDIIKNLGHEVIFRDYIYRNISNLDFHN